MTDGAFIVFRDGDTIAFSPAEGVTIVPESQQTLLKMVIGFETTLKILFPERGEKFEVYFTRLLGMAQVGLVGETPPTALCIDSVEQMKQELAQREGKYFKAQYLIQLGMFGGIFTVLSGISYFFLLDILPFVTPYLVVWAGAMIGLWVSYAMRRKNSSYEELSSMDKYNHEALIRAIYVGIVAEIFALFLGLGLLEVSVGGVNFTHFKLSRETALALGIIAGFSEHTLPNRIVDVGKRMFG